MNEVLAQGLDLMMVGMGTVFTFLIVLVFLTTFMSTMVNRFFPEAAPEKATQPQAKPASGNVDPVTLAVISDAIKQHRARQK